MAGKLRSAFERLLKEEAGRPESACDCEIALLQDHGIVSFNSLNHAVNDPSLPAPVRLAACWALGRVGGSQASGSLLRALKEGDPPISFEAAKSLIALGDKRTVHLIASRMTTGVKVHNRAAAAYALGFLGQRSDSKSLLQILESDDTPEVRAHAAEALGHLGSKRSVKHLIRALKDNAPEVRFWSVFALGEIRDSSALPSLEQLWASDTTILPNAGSIKDEAESAIQRIRAQS